jgi:cytochrome P450
METTASRKLPFDLPSPLRPPLEYAELREREPVAAVTNTDGRPAWLVTSYDAVTAVLSDPRFGVTRPGEVALDGGTLLQDGEPHIRLRRLVGRAFTPRRVDALRPRVEALAEECVRALVAAGPPADLVNDLAAPLSIAVISELLGVSLDERERFRALADAASAADFLAFEEFDEQQKVAAQQTWAEFGGYVAALVAAKRESLGDDLLSDLIAVRDSHDGRLNDYELTTLALTILASGYLTATNAIAVGALLLVEEGRLAALADPGEVSSAVDEIIRLQISLIGEVFPRWAHEDVSLAGAEIKTGDLVLVRLGAANRDPARFTSPDQFMPGRDAAAHLAFGRGPHHCLGAALARLEIGAALHALARHLPALRLDGKIDDIRWSRSHADSGPVAVPVTW